jgi:hypothetical protein
MQACVGRTHIGVAHRTGRTDRGAGTASGT